MATTPAISSVQTRWSLLDRLKGNLALLIVVDIAFLGALIAAQSSHSKLIQTIGVDSAPSIIAAQHIKVAMADMDAESVNQLLLETGSAGPAATNYEARREEAADELISAAKNITYNGEREAIRTLEINLGTYQAKVRRALDFHEDGKEPAALHSYREAAKIIDGTLYPAADKLNDTNFTELEKAYEDDTEGATGKRTLVVIGGMVMLAVLVFVQWDLMRRVRRLLNPGLLCATLLTLGLLSYTFGHLSNSAHELYIAKHDAFDSLHYLWQARALAFAANADESRYLLGDGGREDQDSFLDRTKQISYDSTGFLQKELANITFDGEREAAQETLDKWQVYMAIDQKIRALKQEKKLDEAVKLCIGGSDKAFSDFDDAMMRTIKINKDAFDKAVAAGQTELSRLVEVAAAGTAAIAACIAFGLLVRIREFF